MKSSTSTIFYSPMPTLVHPKPYFNSSVPLETYHVSSLRLSLGLFFGKFWNFQFFDWVFDFWNPVIRRYFTHPYFHSSVSLETYHASSLRLSLEPFFFIFEITNFLIRLWTFEIQDLNDILLTHANFGTYETILPFIRSAWNLPCILFATIPRTVFFYFWNYKFFN